MGAGQLPTADQNYWQGAPVHAAPAAALAGFMAGFGLRLVSSEHNEYLDYTAEPQHITLYSSSGGGTSHHRPGERGEEEREKKVRRERERGDEKERDEEREREEATMIQHA